MTNTKFELTAETQVVFGVTFHRIRALRDIARWLVKAGDLGGWLAPAPVDAKDAA